MHGICLNVPGGFCNPDFLNEARSKTEIEFGLSLQKKPDAKDFT